MDTRLSTQGKVRKSRTQTGLRREPGQHDHRCFGQVQRQRTHRLIQGTPHQAQPRKSAHKSLRDPSISCASQGYLEPWRTLHGRSQRHDEGQCHLYNFGYRLGAIHKFGTNDGMTASIHEESPPERGARIDQPPDPWSIFSAETFRPHSANLTESDKMMRGLSRVMNESTKHDQVIPHVQQQRCDSKRIADKQIQTCHGRVLDGTRTAKTGQD
jgi:hypothetical protein